MARTGRTITRRELLRSAGAGAAGLALTGALGELLTRAGARPRARPRIRRVRERHAPPPPSWHTRPDLRIPALTVTHSEPGASADPIFIAPYNAPPAQAGAVIVDDAGEPIWENPLAAR